MADILKYTFLKLNGGVFCPEDVILVSGGSKGIGKSITAKLLEEGATVVATGRDKRTLEEFAKTVNNERLFVCDIDISKTDEMDDKLSTVEEEIGRPIVALINNAGIYGKTQFPNCTEEDAMRVFSTNA